MAVTKHWTIDLFVDENVKERTTFAEVRLNLGGDRSMAAHGRARRAPEDVEVPEIGDELAAARALSALAYKLLDAAAGDIEQITHTKAHLHA